MTDYAEPFRPPSS